MMVDPMFCELLMIAPRLAGLMDDGMLRFVVISTNPPLVPLMRDVSVSPVINAVDCNKILLLFRSRLPEMNCMPEMALMFL